MADYWRDHEDGGWNIPIRRNLNEWEIDYMAYLYGLVDNVKPRGNVNDSWRWTLSKNGAFTASSVISFSVIEESLPFSRNACTSKYSP